MGDHSIVDEGAVDWEIISHNKTGSRETKPSKYFFGPRSIHMMETLFLSFWDFTIFVATVQYPRLNHEWSPIPVLTVASVAYVL